MLSRFTFWLLLLLSPAVQASVLQELGQSLLTGTGSTYSQSGYRVRPASEQGGNSLLEPDPMRDSDWFESAHENRPGFFLMPLGRGEDSGVGMGIRLPF